MDELSYEEIRRIQAREKGTLLSKLPENFFQLVVKLGENYKKGRNIREYENFLKIVKYIISRREEKIVTAALNASKGVEAPLDMLNEERELYERIKGMVFSYEERMLSSVGERRKSLLVLKDTDKFVGIDGKTYGPFKEGDGVEVPVSEAEALIKMKAARWKE